NAFIIYRKNYVKELNERGINLQMTKLSPIISQAWKDEPENVKNEYKRIAELAKIRHRELWPNSKRTYKKKQKPISFSKPDNLLTQSDMENAFYFPKNDYSTLQYDNNIIYDSSTINNFD
ncbi:14100_t:CDS:1, partial [Cetraspora pellucida]